MTLDKCKTKIKTQCSINNYFEKTCSFNNFLTSDMQRSSSDQSLSRRFSKSESAVNSKYLALGCLKHFVKKKNKRKRKINNTTFCVSFTIFEVALRESVKDLKRLILLVLCTLLISNNSRRYFIILISLYQSFVYRHYLNDEKIINVYKK